MPSSPIPWILRHNPGYFPPDSLRFAGLNDEADTFLPEKVKKLANDAGNRLECMVLIMRMKNAHGGPDKKG